ncbi:MAG: pentapeptide repeat-containing protein [Saprospiraceae bacterium]
MKYVSGQTFGAHEKSIAEITKGEYVQCRFENIDFSDIVLSGYVFEDVVFQDCNLSLNKFHKTAFKGVKFVGCKLVGLHWDHCDSFIFSVYYERCMLNMSSFYGVKLKNTRFVSTQMMELDFTDADLSYAVLDDCDLTLTTFDHTNLKNADLRKATNFIIDPEINHLKNAKFSWPSVGGLLDKYEIIIDE